MEKWKSALRVALRLLLVLACVVGIRLLMGSRPLMYLSALDVERIEVSLTPPGTVLTAVGDDAAQAVTLLSKTVCYPPRDEVFSGQAVTLTIYKHDGSVMTVTACGDQFTMDGKGYRARLSDGESLAQWAQALAQKQDVQS